MVSATTTFVLIALLIRVFAKRYVGTGSLFSYIRHAMGPKASIVMAAALVPGYVIVVSALLLASGLYLGSFLVSIGLEGAGETGGPTRDYRVHDRIDNRYRLPRDRCFS